MWIDHNYHIKYEPIEDIDTKVIEFSFFQDRISEIGYFLFYLFIFI